MSGQTDKQLLAVLRQELKDYDLSYGGVGSETWASLGELEARADERERLGAEWPQLVYDAAVARFGNSIANRSGRTRKGLNRKIEHALHTWDDNYGPLNPEQAAYAAVCLAHCFSSEWELPQTYTRLDMIVHHPTVHAGFLKRAG